MFLSPEEKLLQIRKNYNITQKELVGDSISRVFLGMIETKKRTLTVKTAKILFNNLKQIVENRGLKLNITVDELMKTQEEQSIEFLEIMLKRKGEISFNELWYITDSLEKTTPKYRYDYCYKFYLKFTKEKKYELAKKFFLGFLHGRKNLLNIEKYIGDLFFLCEKTNDPEKAVIIYESLIENKNKRKKDFGEVDMLYVKFLFELKKYEEALEILKSINYKTKFDSEIRKIKIYIYMEQDELELAFKECDLFARSKNEIIKCKIFSKAIDICLERDEKEYLKVYYDKCRRNFVNYEYNQNLDSFKILSSLACASKVLNKKSMAKRYFHEALLLGKILGGEVEKRIYMIGELIEILDKNDNILLKSLEIEYVNLLKENKNYKVAIQILDYYKKYFPEEVSRKISLFMQFL